MTQTTYTDPNRILLSAQGYVLEEGDAGETITPGMLVEIYNSTGAEKLRKHATAKGHASAAFALEDPTQGKDANSSQGRDMNDDYVVTEKVQYAICSPGTRVFAYLKAGTNYVIGDYLESAGDGTLQKITGTADLKAVAQLKQAKNLSASGAVKARAIVSVL